MKLTHLVLTLLLIPTSTAIFTMDTVDKGPIQEFPNPNVVRDIVKEEERADLLQLFLNEITKNEEHLFQLGPIFERDQPLSIKLDVLRHLLAQREKELRAKVEERVRATIGDTIDREFKEYGLIGVDGPIEDKIKTIRSELFHHKGVSDSLRDDRNRLLEEKKGSSQ